VLRRPPDFALDKNPRGYCNMHGTGVACSITGTTGLGIATH